jgi:hypothetical protein
MKNLPARKKQKIVWARLIQKVFEVDPLECPYGGYVMKIASFIFDSESLERTIAWLNHKNKMAGQINKSPPKKKLMTAVG